MPVLIVLFDDGRTIDVDTRSGADAFLQTPVIASSFVGQTIAKCNNLRREKTKDVKTENQILQSYMYLVCLAGNSSEGLFDQCVGETQMKVLVDHLVDVLRELTNDEKWKNTGFLKKHDQEAIVLCSHCCCSVLFVRLFLRRDGFGVLACFSAARKPSLPSTPAAAIVRAAFFGLRVLATTSEILVDDVNDDGIDPCHIAWGTLEAVGLVGQVLRCVTVPPPPSAPDRNFSIFCMTLEYLHKSTLHLWKKFSPNKPTGQILTRVIAGDDGFPHQRNEHIMALLKTIQGTAKLASSKWGTFDNRQLRCYTCGVRGADAELRNCSRCHLAWYCSKECQRKDWPDHKKMSCSVQGQQHVKSENAKLNAVGAFVRKNYAAILLRAIQVMKAERISKKDIFVQVDFFLQDGATQTPALKNEFNIGLVPRYLGKAPVGHPSELGWFGESSLNYEKRIDSFLQSLEYMHRTATSQSLLIVARSASGRASVDSIQMQHPVTDKELLSDNAFDAWLRQDHDMLVHVYGEEEAWMILHKIKRSETHHT